jgi:phage shock protein A
MHFNTKIIDGIEYIEVKVFNDMYSQLSEEIDELDEEIKQLKSQVYILKHPEEVAKVNSYFRNETH